MKVLVDYHHGNLLYSLYKLFEQRLGFEIYRPIGLDWFTNGYFKIAEPYGNAQDTIDQYLSTKSRKWDAFKALNGDYKLKDDIYHIWDHENGFEHRAITFEKFKEMKFDLIVASHPLHNNWKDLLNYQPQAKFIVQIGNEGQTTDARNVLCSTADFLPRDGQNFIRYHQEFDLEDYFYTPPESHKLVRSFVVSLPEPETFFMYKNLLSDFTFEAYGVGSPEGTVHGGDIARMMRESAFGYHVKPMDGYGHVIHKWAFTGRPLITRASYYKGKLAEPLLEDKVTCIDLDKHSVSENCDLIELFSQPENHLTMCENMARRAREVVNFDHESQKIKDWLNYLI